MQKYGMDMTKIAKMFIIAHHLIDRFEVTAHNSVWAFKSGPFFSRIILLELKTHQWQA